MRSAVREAEDVLRLVRALKRPPGVHRREDAPVEYVVARCPEVSRHLAALIEPVATRPELLQTPQALIAAEGNRARAAAELMVHRSTIDYRLRRMGELTGHSPTRVSGLHILGTALLALALIQTLPAGPAAVVFTSSRPRSGK
ncbi:helix-turn-helix domain-containing protein [Streptomyces sp. NBC_01261]|uniref:PucR family transcriptional regulator n=1 Tax=Streptomyces sp. NBC_01261 TaxID=2903802 RepID=UPI002E378AA5|nr:helix-turn-helix domain-containing protein [Streptomyces sp. NBC_01261]